MKTTKVLTAVSAAALLGISSFALAQSSGGGTGGGAGSSGAPPANTMQRQQDAPPANATSPGKAGERMTQDRMGKDTQKSNQAQSPDSKDSKSQMTGQGSKDSTVGAAGSGGVNLTTEQRTTIRQTVLTGNAPRVNNINFSISVGTVVPSSVRVVEVPETIVRINPRWKGYRYFVYNDEIIIVEPRTLKIVAVLEV